MTQMIESPSEWQSLESSILACQRCPRLVAWREEVSRKRRRAYRDAEYWGKPVAGFGDHEARALIVGLAPGAHGANRTGRLFTGDSSGTFLYSALYRAGFASHPDSLHRHDGMALRDAFLSAACRCAPPANKPSPAELAACRPFLECELRLLEHVRVIVALGRIAFESVLHLYEGEIRSLVKSGTATPAGARTPVFGHGAIWRLSSAGPWLIASYHPSRQNTQTGRLTPTMFDAIWSQTLRLLGEKGESTLDGTVSSGRASPLEATVQGHDAQSQVEHIALEFNHHLPPFVSSPRRAHNC
jgi:uracil-DNA glycosylase family 4